MGEKILTINPNSSQYITDALSEALEPLRMKGGPAIECVTLKEGPPGIETHLHKAVVVEPLCRLIRSRDNEAGAFVVACFGDPGLQAARDATRRPVLGMAESSFLAALAVGESFGIIATQPTSAKRHARYIRELGLEARYAGEVAVGIGILDLAKDKKETLSRMIAAGKRLRDEFGAASVITGCAGMAGFRAAVQEAIGIPVIEPTQAAVTLAIGAARVGYA
ncbi:MAG: aspartate/glutamate racemase family protein [Proteobacteria bacterium]|nr:aspartate/glutamate racemase family protein [Pseudomonadota bacterium]